VAKLSRPAARPRREVLRAALPADDPGLSPAVQRVQNLLTHRLATRVVIHHGDKRGTISIEYYGSDDLNRILGELGIEAE
jgi:ParB family chromosome partitioning protein